MSAPHPAARLRVAPFALANLIAMTLPDGHPVTPRQREELALRYGACGNAFAVHAGDRVVMCGGAWEQHPGWASLWAFYAPGLGLRTWGHLLRMARDFIAGLPHGRVDAAVDADDAAARRWAEGCGLWLETTLGGAAPSGAAMLIYRRAG